MLMFFDSHEVMKKKASIKLRNIFITHIIRNNFINIISPSTFKREETFVSAIEKAIVELCLTIYDNYSRVSLNIFVCFTDERFQSALFRVS